MPEVLFDWDRRKGFDGKAVPRTPTSTPSEGSLHFWTWSAFFMLSCTSVSDDNFNSPIAAGLSRFSILDAKGDWCGTVTLDKAYLSDVVGPPLEFLAMSDAHDFTLDECTSWNFYVPSERDEAEWYLYYALMIRWNEKGTIAERLGLAKIYRNAFHTGSFLPGLRWKEIVLG